MREIDGLNLSRSQTAAARERVIRHGHADLAARLHVGDVADLDSWSTRARLKPADAVLALDGAYHFPSRAAFLAAAAHRLAPGGRVGLTDLVLSRTDLHPLRERLPLRLIAAASHIPAANLQVEAAYRADWAVAGLEVETWIDLSEAVLRPFGDWLQRYRAALDPDLARATRWTKFAAVARFLAWAEQARVLRYVLCVGRKT